MATISRPLGAPPRQLPRVNDANMWVMTRAEALGIPTVTVQAPLGAVVRPPMGTIAPSGAQDHSRASPGLVPIHSIGRLRTNVPRGLIQTETTNWRRRISNYLRLSDNWVRARVVSEAQRALVGSPGRSEAEPGGNWPRTSRAPKGRLKPKPALRFNRPLGAPVRNASCSQGFAALRPGLLPNALRG